MQFARKLVKIGLKKQRLIVTIEVRFIEMWVMKLNRSLTEGHDRVEKVTLIPRGKARGLTWFLPGEDTTLVSKKQLFARIVGGLGGRAAEEVIFGEPEITTGAAGDLLQLTQLAKQVLHFDLISLTYKSTPPT